MRVGKDNVLWAISGGAVVSISPDLEQRSYLRMHRPLDIWPDGEIVWVGTENGIDILDIASGSVLDLLRTADNRVRVQAIAADGAGGCWLGTETGRVIHLDTARDGGAFVITLDRANPPEILEIRPVGTKSAWVMTDQGPFALRRQ